MQSIENAIESRKGSLTDIEKLRFILVVRLGDFHLEMNAVIKNIQCLIPSESSLDKCSLSYFAHRIVIEHLLSNKPQKIKKVGHYQMNKQFFMSIGKEFVRDALKSFLSEKVEKICEMQNTVIKTLQKLHKIFSLTSWYNTT